MDLGAIGTTINNFIDIATAIGGLLVVLFLILAGIYFVTSGGSPQGVERAKGAAFNAAVGLAVILSARAITALITNAVAR